MTPHKILFIAEGQLGDLLLLTPALRAARESFPGSSISVLVVERRDSDTSKRDPFKDLAATLAERDSSVLSTNKNVDELLVLNRRALRALHGIARAKAELAIIRFLRRKNFNTVVCTFPEDRFAQWAFASGAAVRVGQRKQGLHWLLTHTPDIEKSERGVLSYYCDLVRAIGGVVQTNETELALPESSLVWAEEFFRSTNIQAARQIVAIHPGASGDYRVWPPERYALLMDILGEKGVAVLLINGTMDEPVVNEIKKSAKQAFAEVRADGRYNLAAIIQRCHLCISNDSGPRHLAVAVGTPSLALFRQHHDNEWGAYEASSRISTLKGNEQCPACPAGICLDKKPNGERFGTHCIRMISVDAAVERATMMLAKNTQ